MRSDGTEALHLIKIKRCVRKREGNVRALRETRRQHKCLMNRQASAKGARTLHNGKDKQTEEEFVFFLGDWGVSKNKIKIGRRMLPTKYLAVG